jgi:hypothetical protein
MLRDCRLAHPSQLNGLTPEQFADSLVEKWAVEQVMEKIGVK